MLKRPATPSFRNRSSRPFPTISFEQALEFARELFVIGNGQPVGRKTLFDHLGRASDSGTSRMLVANSKRYGLINGSYVADQLGLTPDGRRAVDDGTPMREQAQARVKLAILNIDPFNQLYERFTNSKLPAKTTLKDTIKAFGVPSKYADEGADTFVANLRFVGLSQTLSGTEEVLPISRLFDSLPLSCLSTKKQTGSVSSEAGALTSQTSKREHWLTKVGRKIGSIKLWAAVIFVGIAIQTVSNGWKSFSSIAEMYKTLTGKSDAFYLVLLNDEALLSSRKFVLGQGILLSNLMKHYVHLGANFSADLVCARIPFSLYVDSEAVKKDLKVIINLTSSSIDEGSNGVPRTDDCTADPFIADDNGYTRLKREVKSFDGKYVISYQLQDVQPKAFSIFMVPVPLAKPVRSEESGFFISINAQIIDGSKIVNYDPVELRVYDVCDMPELYARSFVNQRLIDVREVNNRNLIDRQKEHLAHIINFLNSWHMRWLSRLIEPLALKQTEVVMAFYEPLGLLVSGREYVSFGKDIIRSAYRTLGPPKKGGDVAIISQNELVALVESVRAGAVKNNVNGYNERYFVCSGLK